MVKVTLVAALSFTTLMLLSCGNARASDPCRYDQYVSWGKTLGALDALRSLFHGRDIPWANVREAKCLFSGPIPTDSEIAKFRQACFETFTGREETPIYNDLTHKWDERHSEGTATDNKVPEQYSKAFRDAYDQTKTQVFAQLKKVKVGNFKSLCAPEIPASSVQTTVVKKIVNPGTQTPSDTTSTKKVVGSP